MSLWKPILGQNIGGHSTIGLDVRGRGQPCNSLLVRQTVVNNGTNKLMSMAEKNAIFTCTRAHLYSYSVV